jgi:hypothetical protein
MPKISPPAGSTGTGGWKGRSKGALNTPFSAKTPEIKNVYKGTSVPVVPQYFIRKVTYHVQISIRTESQVNRFIHSAYSVINDKIVDKRTALTIIEIRGTE